MQNRRLLQNWGFNEIRGSMIEDRLLIYIEIPLYIVAEEFSILDIVCDFLAVP